MANGRLPHSSSLHAPLQKRLIESQTKSRQYVNWGTETCAKRKKTSTCLLAIPAFDRIAGLCNRHLNSNRGICLR